MEKMPNYQTLSLKITKKTIRIILNRPEVHNAFNSIMIDEMNDAFDRIRENPQLRLVVLTGKGRSFCAGADLNWMREIVRYSFEQNMEESLHIADLMYKIHTLPKPTIAMVNGAAIGGGTGFISACDIAVASDGAQFGLSEVKIGLVPAAISPYVIMKIGESRAREYFLSGKRISASEAHRIGLVNQVVPSSRLDDEVAALEKLLLSSGPEAVARCKELLIKVPKMSLEESRPYTARMIAELRISGEGQEGMAAFLEKRKPRWAPAPEGEEVE